MRYSHVHVILSRRGYSNRAIATELGFDESSIRRAQKKGHQSGRLERFQAVLTPEQEKEALSHCKALDSRYYGLTLRSLRHLSFEFAEDNGILHPFKKRKQNEWQRFHSKLYEKEQTVTQNTQKN